MKLLFWNKNGRVCLRVKINDIKAEIITKFDSDGWTDSRTRFTGKGAREKNESLSKMERGIHTIYDAIIAMNKLSAPKLIADIYKAVKARGGINRVDLPQIISDLLNKKSDQISPSLLDVVDMYVSRKKITRATVSTYERRRKNLVRFLMQENSLHILAEDFTRAHLVRFGDMLLADYGQNYAARHICYVREAIEAAFERGQISKCQVGKWTISKVPVKDLRHLDKEHLRKLELLRVSGRLEAVKDMFVFCCYTGLHYADRESIAEAQVLQRGEWYYLRKYRQKTGILAEIKLHPVAMRIAQKYGGLSSLPKIDNATNNLLLKQIEAKIGLNIGLCTKIARKTFAYHMLNYYGVDKDTVARMMGLKSTKHIDDYAEVGLERIERMVNW